MPPGGPGPQQGWGGPPPAWGGAPAGGGTPAIGTSGVVRVLLILSPVLVVAGLTIPQNGSLGWTEYTLWAVFALAASLAPLLTLSSTRSPTQTATLAVAATGALVAYWVVIVLPGISSNGGFLQTIGVGCAVVAAWLRQGRR